MIGEKQLLRKLSKYLGKSSKIVRSFSEDCAVIDEGRGRYRLITVDAFVEGVHFRCAYFPPYYIGRKALKANISDIAAMGGTPQYWMVSLGAPASLHTGFVDEIYRGMQSVAAP